MNEFGKDNEAILSLLSDVYLDMIYAQLKKEKYWLWKDITERGIKPLSVMSVLFE